MNRNPLRILMAVVLLAVVGGWLWHLATSEDVALPDRQATAATGAGTSVDPAELASATTGPAAPTEHQREVPESLFRSAADEADGGRRITIQVWDRVVGAPAADAEVFVLHSANADWGVTKGPFAQHWSSVAEQKGRRFRTNEDGRVEVAGVRDDSAVVAKAPSAYAFQWLSEIQAEDHVEVLTLQSDESVAIRVVDKQGDPVAGAAVGVVERFVVLDSLEELQERTEVLEQWVDGMREWMRNNGSSGPGARAKLEGLEDGLRLARQELTAARQAARRRAQSGARVEQPVSRLEVRARRLTDENGLAVVEHFQLYRGDGAGAAKASGKAGAAGKAGAKGRAGGKVLGKRGAKAGARGRGKKAAAKQEPVATTFEAALLMPLTTPVTKLIPSTPLPEDVIELCKPATASLSLRTVDRDGRPFTHPVHGMLEMLGDESAEWSQVMLRKQQNERAIVFPHVGLGLQFVASCRLDDGDFRWRTGELPGPVAPNEGVAVDLVVAPDAGMLYAKLVDAAGGALAGVSPSFLISSRAGRLEGEEVVTDDAGCCHLPYKVSEDHVAPYHLEVRLNDAVPTRGFAAPLAQLPLAKVTDLGEVVLDGFAEIVRGVVVDDVGTPVADASVQLERERSFDRGAELRFVEEPFVNTRTAADGAFQLFGMLAPGRYRLRVQDEEHFRAYVDVPRSGGEVRVKLMRKCRVVGTVLAPEWMNRKRVSVDLRPIAVSGPSGPSGPSGRAVGPRSDSLRDHGGQTYAIFDWVWPGTYEVSFRLQGYPEPFLVIDHLVVEPGWVGVHPRMQDLDLNAHIFRFEIHPVDENGESVRINRPQLTKITRRDGTEQFIGLAFKGVVGEVLHTSPQLEVMPLMAGYLAEKQVLAPGRNELVFRSIPPVHLVFAGLSAMAREVPTRVVLVRQDMGSHPDSLAAFDDMSERVAGWYTRAPFTTSLLDEFDTAPMRVTGDGAHKIILHFGNSRKNLASVELPAINIKVVAGSEVMRVAVPYDTELLREKIESARAAMQASGK